MSTHEASLYRRTPLPDEIDAANAEITEHEHAIAALEAQIKNLMTEISSLRTTQRGHYEHIRRCKGVITLARRLPEELLTKIFEHCVADGWTRAPMVVSHVCSTWRKAAMAPLVWSRIYLDADSTAALGRTRFWLQRVREVPIDIELVASWHTPRSQLADTIDLLCRRSCQWQSLRITMDGLDHTAFAIANFTHPMENLRTIEIQTCLHEDGDMDSNLTLSRFFNQQLAPKLSTVHFSCNVFPESLRLPSHITMLDLNVLESPFHQPMANVGLVDLLNGLPNLRRLVLQLPLVYNTQIADEDQSRIADLPQLTSLTINGPSDLNGMLAHLRVSKLRELRLRSFEDDTRRLQEPLAPSLMQFLANSQPALELLELHDSDLPYGTFVDCLRTLPDLRTLRLHESSISDDTIRLFSGPNALCPKLTQLGLRWCSHLGGHALVEVIKNRATPNGHTDVRTDGSLAVEPITELDILNCCFVGEQDVLQLARMATVRLLVREDDYCRTCRFSPWLSTQFTYSD